MSNLSFTKAVLDNIKVTYRVVVFEAKEVERDLVLIRVVYLEKDVNSNKLEKQFGRWWVISPPFTENTIVKTAFSALEMSDGHVRRENFYYEDRRIFDPHYSIGEYLDMARTHVRD